MQRCITPDEIKATMLILMVLGFLAGFCLHWIIHPYKKEELTTFDFETEKDEAG